jgi:hypothetical protein
LQERRQADAQAVSGLVQYYVSISSGNRANVNSTSPSNGRKLGQLGRYHTNNSSNVDISSFWLMPLCLPTVISNELSSPPDYASSRPDLGHCQHDSHRVSDQSCRTPLWARLLSTSVASSSLDEKAQALLCEISAISKSHVVLQPACIRPIVD